MRTAVNCIVYLVIASTLCACGGSDAISRVKNGTLNSFQQTTIGEAFDSYFKDPKWEKIETANGAIVVQFNGKTSPHKVSAATKEYAPGKTLEFMIQFMLNKRNKTFKIQYVTVYFKPTTEKGRKKCLEAVKYGGLYKTDRKGYFKHGFNMRELNVILGWIYNRQIFYL